MGIDEVRLLAQALFSLERGAFFRGPVLRLVGLGWERATETATMNDLRNETSSTGAEVSSSAGHNSAGLRRVAVIINPAAGRDRPILAPINRALWQSGVEWKAYVIRRGSEDDTIRDAILASPPPDLVLVYGGDGTNAEVATAILRYRDDLCLAPLGGGTANGLAETLGAPADLEQAVEQICAGRYRALPTDVGMAEGRAFLLRASIGATTGLTSNVTREEKDRLGTLAYALSGLRALGDVRPQTYRIVVDGQTRQHEAVSVIVANSPAAGLRTVIASDVLDRDQRLDVFVVPTIGWVTHALANVVLGEGLMEGAVRYRACSIQVECETPALVHLDGEPAGETPATFDVRPSALKLLHYLERE